MSKKPVPAKAAPMSRNTAELIHNALMSRQALIEQFLDTKGKDINKECGYPGVITVQNYKELYDREGIGARVVDVYPTETWQEDPEVVESMDGDESEFETAWEELTENRNLYHYLALVDEVSGIGRFGCLFLGIDDGKPFDQPVVGIDAKGIKVGTAAHKLLYLRAMDESCLKIKTFEKEIKNPRFGEPTMYQVTFKGEDDMADIVSNVHWTRMIHVADNRTDSQVFGRPRMKNCFNRLYDLRKVLGGSGEMFWKGGFPGLSMQVNPDMTDVDFDEKSIAEQVQKYDRGLQRYLAIQGITAKSLSVQVADPSKHVETALRAIAITLAVPFRIFLGSEQSQLASSQDVKSWNKRIKKRQQKYVTPFIVRPFVDRMIAFGVLPEPKEPYHVIWPDLGAPTAEEKADVGVKRTTALTSYITSGLSTLIPPMEYLTLILGMEDEEAESIVDSSGDFADFTNADVNPDPNAQDQEDPKDTKSKAGKAKPAQKKGPLKNAKQRMYQRQKQRKSMGY